MRSDSGPPVMGSSSAPGAQARSNVGAVGVMSTPELLAKRLQRQKAEREAMAGRISRPNLARRLLQPVQNQQPTQQQQQQPGRPMTNTGLSFSRTPKRSVEKQQPAPEEPTGVSVEELAKLLDDDAAGADSPAKRLKLTDIGPSMQQQQEQAQQAAGSPTCCPSKACLLSQRQQDTASLGAISQRAAAQRQQRLAEDAAAATAAAAAAAPARTQVLSHAQDQLQAAAIRSQAASVGDAAAAASNRWLYKPAQQPQQQQELKASKQAPTVKRSSAHGGKPAAKIGAAKTGVTAGAVTGGTQQQQQRQQHKQQEQHQARERAQSPPVEAPGSSSSLRAAKRSALSSHAASAGKDLPRASLGEVAGVQLANQLGGRAAAAAAAAAVAVGGKKHLRPMEQLASVTVDTPSRRLQQLETGKQDKQQRSLGQRRVVRPLGRTCAPIMPVEQQQQQQHQQVQPQRETAGGGHCHVSLPSPLAQRIAAATSSGPGGGAEGGTAASSEPAPAAAAPPGGPPCAAGKAGAGPTPMLVLDLDDAADDILGLDDDDLEIAPPVAAAAVQRGQAAAAADDDDTAAGSQGLAAHTPWTAGTAAAQQHKQQQEQCAVHIGDSDGGFELLCDQGGLQSDRAFGWGAEEEHPCTAGGVGMADHPGSDECWSSDSGEADNSGTAGEESDGGSSSSGWQESDSQGMQLDEGEQDSEAGADSGDDGQRIAHSTKAPTRQRSRGPAAAAAAASRSQRPQRACTRARTAVDAAQRRAFEASDDEQLSLSGEDVEREGEEDEEQEEEDHDEEEEKAVRPVTRKRTRAVAGAVGRKRAAKQRAADEEVGEAETAVTAGKTQRKAAAKKPRAKKTSHRQNFRRHTHNGGYGFKFLSKSGARGGKRSFRRVTMSGKLIIARRKAPHMAGQGAEFVDGFAGGPSGGGGMAGKGRCFKCGQAGHWAADCPLNTAAIAAQEAEMAAWRTAQEGQEGQADAAGTGAAATPAGFGQLQGGIELPGAAGVQQQQQQQQPQPPHPQPPGNGYHQHSGLQQQQQPAPPQPLSQAELCAMAGLEPDAPWQPDQLTEQQLLGVLQGVWGYQSFRGQQLPLIQSALQGRSMLGVLPTGLGKSLTYQLPALLLQGLVVVVSPLLALMRDQLDRLPKGLPGAMLQGSMNRQEVEQVLERAETGQLRLLYVAPEKLSARPVMQCLAKLSPLPLVCVDEAHCMAEWGQGFRPAYFRLGHLLCNVLRPRAVLALTATATPVTRSCVRQLLAIPPEQQLVESPLRNNLRLQVLHCNGASKGGGIAARVVQMLTTGELSGANSIVVYAGFKAAADNLAAQLQRAAVPTRPYHAGLSLQQREAVQSACLSGAVRVVVATVAFGMGVDKQDLDAVLHTCLPHSLEEYVQQVGRAGRDGRTGHCMLFLDDADYVKLRTLAHGGTARHGSIELFLAKVFGRECEYEPHSDDEAAAVGKKRKRQPKLPPSRHRALPLQDSSVELDLSEEVMEGCLSFLQADPVEPYLTALPNTAATIDVRFHRSTPEQLAEKHPVVASILHAKCRKYAGTYKVHMPALLSAADRPPGELLGELASLAAAHEVGMDMGRQGALVWRLERQPEDWQQLVGDMALRLEQVMRASVLRLDRCYAALAGAAFYDSQAAQERHLRAVINEYFMDEQAGDQPDSAAAAAAAGADPGSSASPADGGLAAELCSGYMEDCMETGEMPWGGVCPIRRPCKEALARQMRACLKCAWSRAQDLGRAKFNGLAFARMLAGLASPAVPASVWRGCSEWGRLAAVDFRLLMEVGTQVVDEFWSQQQQADSQQPQLLRQRR